MKSIKNFLPKNKLNRSLLFLIGSTCLAVGLSVFSHYRYWQGTIKAVQTTELNILSHTLPTKLSLLIKNENQEEIKRVLDSAYGFIGLVITNCKHKNPECEEEILYKTQKNQGWGKNLEAKNLKEFPYDPLFDPPPLKTEGNYDHSYDHKRNQTGQTNQGEIIGRVYYIRSSSPSYWEGLLSWLSDLVKLKSFGIIHPYTFYFTICLVGGFFSWRLTERELDKLDSLYTAQRQEAESKIRYLEQRNQSLKEEVEFLHNKTAELQQERENQEEQVKQQKNLIAKQEEEVKNSREQLREKEKSLQSLKEANSTSQDEINQLEQEIESLSQNINEKENTLKEQKDKLLTTQRNLERAQFREKQLRESLEEKEHTEQVQQQQLQQLKQQQQQQLREWEELAKEAWQERDDLRKQLNEIQDQVDYYKLEAIEKQEAVDNLLEQLNELYRWNDSQSDSSLQPKAWSVCCTKSFNEWWQTLEPKVQEKLSWTIRLLDKEGISLPFPHCSNVNGTRYSHIRELRATYYDQPYRIFYAFDPNRIPILLIGGNKRGEDDQSWYQTYSRLADQAYENHLNTLEEEGDQNAYLNFGDLLGS